MSTLQELFERTDEVSEEELDQIIAELRKLRAGFNATGQSASLKKAAAQPTLLTGKIEL
jgi:hypothetical protein